MAVREPIIAIVGRPNVGKSTLFNRILGEKKAVVQDEPGVTRDRNYARITRFSVPFHLIDTGGFEAAPEDELTQAVVEQTLCAAEEADKVFCLFDAHSGLHPGDHEVMQMLRRRKCSVTYIANKCDGAEQAALAAEFYSLGMNELEDISALHGRGVVNLIEDTLKSLPTYDALYRSVKDLRTERDAREDAARAALEKVIAEEDLSEESEEPEQKILPQERDLENTVFAPVYVPEDAEQSVDDYIREFRTAPGIPNYESNEQSETAEEVEEIFPVLDCIRIAIVGRPNVGKSTLLNTLLGEKRAITSDIAGTTRDCLDQEITRDGQKYLLVDTAGLRKKARVSDTIERYSTIRAINAVRDADVAVVLIDATRGPSEQDAKILGIAHDAGKGIVIGVNKWDAVEKDHRTVKETTQDIRDAFKFCRYAPIVFISALSGKRCPRVIQIAKDVAIQRMRRVHTGKLNRVLKRAHQRYAPPAYRGRSLKLFFASQVSTAPPTFVLFFNFSKSLHFSYMRFLKNALRDAFDFHGTDLRLLVRKRGNEGKSRR